MITKDCKKNCELLKSIEEALVKRALGYEVTETKIDSDGRRWGVKKHIPPDIKACIYILNHFNK